MKAFLMITGLPGLRYFSINSSSDGGISRTGTGIGGRSPISPCSRVEDSLEAILCMLRFKSMLEQEEKVEIKYQ